MTTATSPSPGALSKSVPTRASTAKTAVPITTLVAVELRKMTDTRAGRWLLIGVAAIVVIVLGVVVGTGDADARGFTNLAAVAQLPMSILLPILGVLAATSEWSQRTVLTTFSLVPSRGRVLSAKAFASMLLALASVVFCLAAAAVAALIAPLAGDTASSWNLGLSNLAEFVVFQELSMLSGLALGTLLLNSALAIVLYFVLPTLWGGITQAFDSLSDVQAWFDTSTSWLTLISTNDPMTGEAWAQAGASALLWIALPLTIGLARVLRREID